MDQRRRKLGWSRGRGNGTMGRKEQLKEGIIAVSRDKGAGGG